MLTASGLSLAHGSRVLFRDVTLALSPGRRVALVGANGQGKTSLLEILVGRRTADSGSITKPRDMRIGYLPQEIPSEDDGTVLDTVLGGRPDIMHLHHQIVEGPADASPEALDAFGEAQTRYEQLGGYALEADAHSVLAGLGFAPDDADRQVSELSGGWRMRVALARLLLSGPDLLVLDEPTNHLDVDSVGWLEARLRAWTGALLFVSHDRDFIDNVATHVVELANETLTEYVGGFAEFVVQREERIAQLEAQAASQAKARAQTERFVERFRYKATKARQVQSRIKMLEKLEKIEIPDRKELQARFQFPEPPRTSRVVAELRGVTAGYGDTPVLRDVSVHVERGQKLALVGPNGAGKTTLLKMILGDLPPMSGEAEIGQSVTVARFEQHQADELDPSKTVLQIARDGIGSDTPRGKSLRTYLASFGFRDDAVERQVGVLSGGERTRLALAKVMAQPAGLLILDEPTNHLDLASCDMLEDALKVYPGTVLLVTHDRYLIRSVADDLIEVRGGTARFHHGVDEAVLTPSAPTTRRDEAPPKRAAKQAKPKQPKGAPGGSKSNGPAAPPKAKARPTAPAKDAQRERELRKQVNRLEKQWEQAEAKVAELQQALADPDVYADADRLTQLTTALDAAKDEAVRLMTDWEQSASRLERLA
ncbi:MAG TPA: ABC-F family ATP-binding cassette domain-containing protein [Acidimicrobiales bacterium]|nr:ABC-F family ATP-binding cassette domain-containing protein [Acidimicrobiales bacterium]